RHGPPPKSISALSRRGSAAVSPCLSDHRSGLDGLAPSCRRHAGRIVHDAEPAVAKLTAHSPPTRMRIGSVMLLIRSNPRSMPAAPPAAIVREVFGDGAQSPLIPIAGLTIRQSQPVQCCAKVAVK